MDVNKIDNVWVEFNKIISQFLFRNTIYKFLIISFTKFFYIFVFYGRSNLEATKFLNGKKKKEIASPFQVHRGFQKTPMSVLIRLCRENTQMVESSYTVSHHQFAVIYRL